MLVLAGLPFGARAGFFSLFTDLLKINNKDTTETVVMVSNSQTISLLEAKSMIDPDAYQGGGDIIIVNSALVPEQGPLGTRVDLESELHQPDDINLYIVREGDTLSEIAEMFKVSVNTIRWANDNIGARGTIKMGDELVILPINGVEHIVVRGDTMAKIAKKYNIPTEGVQEIAIFNGIEEDSGLEIGAKIIVPGGEINTPIYVSSPSSSGITKKSNSSEHNGYYTHPLLGGGHKTQSIHGRNAIDIGVPTGTPIIASAEGIVIISDSSGWNGGYGGYIVISHPNGTETLYAHMNKTAVGKGASVIQGQVIGWSGSTGRSTGPHLHFEVRGAKNPF